MLYQGTEVVELSPTAELPRTLEVVEKNMAPVAAPRRSEGGASYALTAAHQMSVSTSTVGSTPWPGWRSKTKRR